MILEKKTCLITGGGSGIGRAAAFRLAEEGAEVWIAGIDLDSLKKTAREIGDNCIWKACNVTSEDEVQQVIEDMPRLDILVANAAVSYPIDLLQDPIVRWREMIEVTMWGVVFSCRAAGRKMIGQGNGGRIIIISSILSSIAEPGSAHYAMAKAALNQLGRQLAVEWAQFGILVNIIAPGCVQTPMSYAGGSNEYESEWFKQFFIHPEHPRLPLMRPAQPEEIAEAVLFFANPRNSYCTGSTLAVDGGLTIKF
jgi:NAD(P)-dependent dehydrogenase (short-subunit alcohol dehydrogenase family)